MKREARSPARTKRRRSAAGAARGGVTWATVRELALALPGVVEGTSYGTPAFHVQRKFLLRLKEDGESIALKIDFADRDVLLQLDPETFYLTDHYLGWPALLVRLPRIRKAQLREVLGRAWRFAAPPRLVAARAGVAREGREATVRGAATI